MGGIGEIISACAQVAKLAVDAYGINTMAKVERDKANIASDTAKSTTLLTCQSNERITTQQGNNAVALSETDAEAERARMILEAELERKKNGAENPPPCPEGGRPTVGK